MDMMFEGKIGPGTAEVPVNDAFWKRYNFYLTNRKNTMFVKDKKGNITNVSFAEVNCKGYLSKGIDDIINFYRLQSVHRVEFHWFKYNCLLIKIFNESNTEIEYPPLDFIMWSSSSEIQQPETMNIICSTKPHDQSQHGPKEVIVLDDDDDDDAQVDVSSPDERAVWSVKLSASSASGNQVMYIPAGIARGFMLHEHDEIEIHEESGRTESWKLCHKRNRGTETYICHGWYEFARCKGLRAGNTIRFELLSNPLRMTVHIEHNIN